MILTDPPERKEGPGGEWDTSVRKMYFEIRDHSLLCQANASEELANSRFLLGGVFRKILLETTAQRKALGVKMLNMTY